jgi:hypothetical protein
MTVSFPAEANRLPSGLNAPSDPDGRSTGVASTPSGAWAYSLGDPKSEYAARSETKSTFPSGVQPRTTSVPG